MARLGQTRAPTRREARASVSTYLNFNGTTEEAFLFYAEVFGTEFVAPIFRLGDGPPMEPKLPKEVKRLVMNVQLPILAGHVIMESSALEDMFWGSYFGTCLDRFGIRWMFNCYEPVVSLG